MTPDRSALIAEIREIVAAHSYCASLAAIVAACDTGDAQAVSTAVNAAFHDPMLRSPSLRAAMHAWGDKVNAAREAAA